MVQSIMWLCASEQHWNIYCTAVQPRVRGQAALARADGSSRECGLPRAGVVQAGFCIAISQIFWVATENQVRQNFVTVYNRRFGCSATCKRRAGFWLKHPETSELREATFCPAGRPILTLFLGSRLFSPLFPTFHRALSLRPVGGRALIVLSSKEVVGGRLQLHARQEASGGVRVAVRRWRGWGSRTHSPAG